MAEFWEESFKVNREMWGFDPAKSTVLINDFFVEQSVKNVLIPGIGYGRNAQLFRENGMKVTGIEISKTAIDLAHKHFGEDLLIHHGSATEMPFDENLYDGIYCYALLHLLDKNEREKLIQDCYNQLAENGFMVFATVSKKAPMFGQGIPISKDRFEVFGSVKMYFYDRESIEKDFAKAGLFEIEEVDDIYPFYLIKCKKTG
ncbi:class I SAM-dependent methyltransferase [Kaistella yonginensis]|uniref:class I SAM-dependent methyltransferase n=1 Tax=Kaistella yonginensis TaxID=658267 RepID=UPI0025B32F28|nr:class I SAM-dependent methyltransferase [Kaistella yonginensis]MDN3607742.1 class I SAM-dependent methyltransferase [Kaistella yonginensis]